MNRNRIAVLALALSMIAASALAGGPLANCTPGQPYRWAGGGANIPFNPDQGSLGPLNNAAAVAAVQQAFDVWAAVPTSTVTYVNNGLLPVDVNITNFGPYENAAAPDGLSAIVFDHTGQIFDLLFGPGSGVLGFAGPEWGTPATCTITEGLSFLNGPAFGDPLEALDVMVHEYGHYTNLAHTSVNGQLYLGVGETTGPNPLSPYPAPPGAGSDIIETMYPFYYGPLAGTHTLEADDVASVSALYPDASFAARGSISGTIFAANGTTRLTGVNVIARNEANPFVDAVSAISSDWTDGTAQTDPLVGTYTLRGLTPGAQYRVYVDEILDGGFSTPLATPLAGPEEYYSIPETNSDSLTAFALVTPNAANVNVIFNSPQPGSALAVGDDGNVQLALPFSFTVCEQTFNSVFVNANGNLTFGTPSTDFSESVAEFLNLQPRIAGWWDDLNAANPQALVTYSQSNNDFTVSYSNVPEFPNAGSNTFSITLRRSSNHIDLTYGSMTALDGLAGVSCGGAITSRSETGTDLSVQSGRINLHNQPAVFQLFTTASPNDLAGRTVGFTGTTAYNDNWAGPNDVPSKARSISLPFNSTSVGNYTEIEPEGADIDWYRFSASAGTSLVAETTFGNLDTMIIVLDATGNVVGFDDDSGPALLSRAVVPLTVSGDYIVGVTTFPDNAFTGAGAGTGRYVLNLFTVVGQLVALGDDSSVSVPLGFTFPYQGGSFTSVFINSNGNLTFGASNTDLSETVAELLSGPRRIAPLWDDLNPSVGGLVLIDRTGSSAKVSWVGVPEFGTTNSNTFSVTMNASGAVSIDYGAVAVRDAITGVTQGGGAANPGESNLASAAAWPVAGTTYELFLAADPFDLAFQLLSFNP